MQLRFQYNLLDGELVALSVRGARWLTGWVRLGNIGGEELISLSSGRAAAVTALPINGDKDFTM